MKIAFVSRQYPPSAQAGGIATYVWESAHWLADHGHQVYVVAASDDVSRECAYVEQGVNVTRLPGGDFFIGSSRSIVNTVRSLVRRLVCRRSYRRRVADKLQSLVDAGLVDLVEFPEYGDEALVWAERTPRSPWVVRLHTPAVLDRRTGRKRSWTSSPLIRWLGRSELVTLWKADAITSCSQSLADIVRRLTPRSAHSILVLPNAVAVDRWLVQSRHAVEPPGRDHPKAYTICSAGQIVAEKGFGELVKAARLLRGRGLNVQLILAGKHGRLGRSLVSLAKTDPEYQGWLKLPGALPRHDLASKYSSADLVVFPSWWEAFGLVCVEAMAAGALVLGSTEGGMREIIQDGKDGFLVKPGDSVALAAKIQAIISLPEETRTRIRCAANESARMRFDVGRVMERQLAVYQEITQLYANQRLLRGQST
jgi:glycogen(starch) synthase